MSREIQNAYIIPHAGKGEGEGEETHAGDDHDAKQGRDAAGYSVQDDPDEQTSTGSAVRSLVHQEGSNKEKSPHR